MRKILAAWSILVLAASFVPALSVSALGPKEFPHSKHIEAGVECETCHAAAESGNLKHSLLPDTTTCLQCHDQSELVQYGWTEIPPRHSGFRNYSHKQHLELGLKCEHCHDASLPFMGLGAVAVKPNHAICMECHDGVKQENDCELCHSNLQEDRLSGMVPDPSMMQPLDHHPGFLHDHQFAVRLNGRQCADCHRQEDFCSECHQGENVDVMVHGRNWIHTHPLSARKNLVDCASCHEIGTFCGECHAENGIRPGDHLAPNWRGSLHAETARKDMEYCASCHDQDADFVCSTCHRDTGGQNDQPTKNIHPPGFRSDAGHGYWHDDPGAACFACHTRPVPATAGVGFCGYCHGAQPGK